MSDSEKLEYASMKALLRAILAAYGQSVDAQGWEIPEREVAADAILKLFGRWSSSNVAVKAKLDEAQPLVYGAALNLCRQLQGMKAGEALTIRHTIAASLLRFTLKKAGLPVDQTAQEFAREALGGEGGQDGE